MIRIPIGPLARKSVFHTNKQNDDIAKHFMEGFRRLRAEGTFCDIKVKVDDVEIVAHKAVLCACSPYFSAMLTGTFLESGLSEIEIKDIDGDSLRILIDFLYTGTLQFTAENVESVLLTASFLQITSAEDLCCEFLALNLCFENCLYYIKFAGKGSVRGLLNEALQVAVVNFHRVFCEDEYLSIEFDEFLLFVKKLNESITNGDGLFAFVMRWINHSYDTRQQYTQELISLLNPNFVSQNILQSDKILHHSNPDIDNWKAEITGNQNDLNPTHILISKRIGSFQARVLNITEPSSGQHQLMRLPTTYYDGSYSCNGYYIYHHGGWQSKRPTSDSFVYDPKNQIWMPWVPLLKARAYHRSCMLDTTIFIAGGSNGHAAIASMESIDLCSGIRKQTAPLPRAKELMGFASDGYVIYSIGGRDRALLLSCAHRMDTRVGKWEQLASTPYAPGASSCAVINDHIYTTHSGCMQRYDMRTNKWTLIFTQYNRYAEEVFPHEQEIYGLFKDHIARYVRDNGRWAMHYQFRYHHEYLHVTTNLCCHRGDPAIPIDVIDDANIFVHIADILDIADGLLDEG